MHTNAVTGFGYYGKVPARGDFIQGNLPAGFVEGWNEWLQAIIAVSKEQLEEQWLEYYLTSPVWHFSLSPGVCGDSAVAGTLMPSVDSAGRYFYFTLAAPVNVPPVHLWQEREWSQLSEKKILKLLDDDTDVVRWAKSVSDIDWLDAVSAENTLIDRASNSQHWVLAGKDEMKPEHLLHYQLSNTHGRYCIWWINGSEYVAERCVVTEELPLVSQFAAMIDGNWEQWGW